MPENRSFLPEGMRVSAETCSFQELKEMIGTDEIMEAIPYRCDTEHTLHFSINGCQAQMKRSNAIAPWISGSERDISLLSMVGKPTCFTVTTVDLNNKGEPVFQLNRRIIQERIMDHYIQQLKEGMILICRVTHMERFGVFLDIGCGIIAMLPIEYISVSRISHPKERFYEGQKLLAAVLSIDRKRKRITMTHRELLGTWMENASYFKPGETVQGAVRSIKPYGAFIELTPNLSGLTDQREDLVPGDRVSVFIKSIQPERMKIKLQVISKCPPSTQTMPWKYFVTDGRLQNWVYSPKNCEKRVETIFKESSP